MSRTLKLAVGAITFIFSSSALAETGPISAEIVEESDGTRTLIHEAVIEAPLKAVWSALSTEEGWKAWGPKFARFDLRQGGSIETGYHDGAKPGDAQNIRHRILAFVPERMIALKVEKVPEGGPVNLDTMSSMWGIYELESLGDNSTRLRISGLGYGPNEASSQMLEFFKTGNVYSIELLRKNLAANVSGDAN